jgi:ribonuclease HI
MYDLIELTKAMIDKAEASEENSCILTLDQEKAYDRIKHDYLWEALKTFGIPELFITTVKNLYAKAETVVVINGKLSEAFPVTRGVQQGDPLSCLLFNLAIEPLACAMRNSEKLQGYEIPGLDRKLIISLFADDATVFLNVNDRMADVQALLNKWCQASGAKFNIMKTEILPIGTPKHRSRVRTTRKLHTDDECLPENIRIVEDTQTMRTLGCRVGYNTREEEPWTPVINKINKSLNTWKKGRPTICGKKHIIQQTVGGMTQFLTAVQGMPEPVIKTLEGITQKFIWDNKKSEISLEVLQRSKDEGGIGLINLRTCNEAIDTMRLKRYLAFGDDWPLWAHVVDALITITDPEGTMNGTKSNSFLQSWKVPVNGSGWGRALPESVTRMFNAAYKYNVSFEALKISEKLKKELPAWHHLGALKRVLHTKGAKCLRTNHDVSTVEDLTCVTARVSTNRRDHKKIAHCACIPCKTDRQRGCKKPWHCVNEALRMLDLIKPKLRPTEQGPTDGLSLTRRRKKANKRARKRNGEILFDPTVTCKANIAECFRIFTAPFRSADSPPNRLSRPTNGITVEAEHLTIYTDGSGLRNGLANATCGAGVWFGPGDARNLSIRPPTKIQSNQVGELVATGLALREALNFALLTIITDSKYVIEGLTSHLSKWEDEGFIGKSHAEIWQWVTYLARKRSAPTKLKWVKGHTGVQGNKGADALAGAAAEKPTADALDMTVAREYNLTGAKMAALTQAIAERGIRDTQAQLPRRQTDINMSRTQATLEEFNGDLLEPSSLWRGIRHKAIRRNIRQFLFKAMHGTQKIGKYWTHIPQNEQRAYCNLPICEGETESLEHILIECSSKVRDLVWKIAQEIWPYNAQSWPKTSLGCVLGSGSLKVKINPARVGKNDEEIEEETSRTQRPNRGASCLLTVLISEAAHLIWCLRNERVIQDKVHPLRAVANRFMATLDNRMQLDRIVASKTNGKKGKALGLLVSKTWGLIIADPQGTPPDWASNPVAKVTLKKPATVRRMQQNRQTNADDSAPNQAAPNKGHRTPPRGV